MKNSECASLTAALHFIFLQFVLLYLTCELIDFWTLQGVTDIMSIDTTGSTSDSVGPPPSPTKGGDAGAAAAGVRTTSVAGSMFDQVHSCTMEDTVYTSI